MNEKAKKLKKFFIIFSITFLISSLFFIVCEKAEAQEPDTIYCPYQNTIIGSIGADQKGLGIVYSSYTDYGRPIVLTAGYGAAFWYNSNMKNIDVYYIGIGTEVYRWEESHTIITLNYNQIMNYDDLSEYSQRYLNKNFHKLTFEFIGYIELPRSIVAGIGYDFIDHRGRFLIGYKF